SNEEVFRYQPEKLMDFSDWSEEIKEVRIGLQDAVSKWYGTANLLSSLPISAAGKTGSAQTTNNTRTNAFFVGYAPAEEPEIAILVLIENAREGSLNAVPIAKDVLEWYYYNRIMKHKP
ncbi:MAG: penicillin-binding transpeptidase domain-containing protein, partial [Patescibacteria group bacterium]